MPPVPLGISIRTMPPIMLRPPAPRGPPPIIPPSDVADVARTRAPGTGTPFVLVTTPSTAPAEDSTMSRSTTPPVGGIVSCAVSSVGLGTT